MKHFHQSKAVFAAALIAVCVTVVEAQAFTTSRGATVNQLDANQFEISAGNQGSSGYGYWCAASNYVTKGLGQPWPTKITIARARMRSATAGGRESVVFTINPSALGITTTSASQINALGVGQTMNAQFGASLCFRGGAGSSR